MTEAYIRNAQHEAGPALVRKAAPRKRKTGSPKIIFTTYQSSPLLASAARAAKADFDLAILDETVTYPR